MKERIMEQLKGMKKRIFAVLTVASVMALTSVTVFASDPSTANQFAVDWTGVDFSGIVTGITGALPFIIPTVVGFIGLRKGIQFVRGMLKGA
jgi:hypothetical protein